MYLHILSDLHLEFAPFAPSVDAAAQADAIVLAGDIGVGEKGVTWAAKTFPGKPVIYVIGNHEFYGGNISRTSIACHEAARGTNVHLLDNSEVVIDGVRFLGCTLWTDFKLFGDDMANIGLALHMAKQRLNDFSVITFGTTGWMTPAQSVILHNTSIEWLHQQLAKPFDGKTVVVTHHAPSLKSIAERYKDDLLTTCFASSLEDIAERADLWIHGHTHNDSDYMIGKCRVICNPRGYVTKGAVEYTGFKQELLVEV